MTLDSIIFLAFLVINITVGLYSARGIKTIREYAVGDGNFSAMVIAATLVATWVSGSDFFTYLSESYDNGLYFIWAALGDAVWILIIGFIFAPRLGEFIGKLSIADAMGDLYGNKVRIITAVAGCVGAGGFIAAQLKVSGMLIEYGFGIPSLYGVVIAAVIVGIYTSFGGIKSVTFTDVIQLFTFGTLIPTLAFFIFGSLDSFDVVTNTLINNEMFDYKKVFDFSQPKAFSYLLLFIFLSVPDFGPAIFQRISMAKNTLQVRQSFIIAGMACLFITLTMSFTGVLVLSAQPGIDPSKIVQHILTQYSYIGLKGLTLAGLMAMVMSTADSFINSTSVLVVNDICKPLGIKLTKNDLTSTRISACIITTLALFIAFTGDNLLELIISTQSIFMPIVSVPFMLAAFGFRTSTKSVLISMCAGFSTVIILKVLLQYDPVATALIAILANLVFLLGSHYLLNQPGGWLGIKDEAPLISLRQERRRNINNFIKKIINFNFFNFLKKSTPTKESMYVVVSFFCIIVTYAVVFTLPKDIAAKYNNLIDFIYPSMLFMATALLSYPLWPRFLKETNHAIVIVWNAVLFYILICACLLFLLISNFASIQLTVFMINLILLSILLRWQLALSMIIFGGIITVKVLKHYLGFDILSTDLDEPQFKVVYLLLITSGILAVFLKPKQEAQELNEARQEFFDEQMNHKNDEVTRSLQIKSEFLNNISHEIRIPINGITSLGQSLDETYENLSEEKRRSAIKMISSSSKRLESFMNNILDLSKLTSLTYKLNLQEVNLSELIYERVEACKKLYLDNKELEFITNIDQNILIICDRHYIKSSLDNLIINAIKYTLAGKITINLHKNELIKFSIQDEGIGVPQQELHSIFNAFTVSSRTYTTAGGRGVGLALSKKAIEMHKGKIWAESDGNKGSTIFFTLPI